MTKMVMELGMLVITVLKLLTQVRRIWTKMDLGTLVMMTWIRMGS